MFVRLIFFLCLFKHVVSEIPLARPYYGEHFLDFSLRLREKNVFLESIFSNLNHLQNSSEVCRRQLEVYWDSLKNHTSWALKYIDSSGCSIQPGLLTGNTVNLGAFDECVSPKADEGFRGNYCWLKIELFGERPHRLSYIPNNNPIIFTLCVPESCNERDLTILTKSLANQLNFSVIPTCQTARPTMTTLDFVAVSSFSLIGLFTLTTLLPKKWIPLKNDRFMDFWSCFDLNNNIKTLYPSKKTGNILASLYGIRFISQCCILWYHLIMATLVSNNPVQNKFMFNELYRSWTGAIEIELILAVDAFFVMGGIVLTYNCLRKKTELNLLKYYIHRYLRLTPPLLGTIIFVGTFCNKICTGPLCLVEIDPERTLCKSYWWTNLLYINNYYPGLFQSCLPHTWYLAADWQLFMFVSPFVVTVINKKPQHVYKFIGGIFLSSIIYAVTIAIVFDLPSDSLLFESVDVAGSYYDKFYVTPFVRAGPWSVGMCLGVFLYDCNRKPFKLSKSNKLFCWIASAVCLFSSIFLLLPFLQENSHLSIWAKVAFISLNRNVFAIALAWIVLACSMNISGPIGKLLVSPALEPLGKLSYSMYLIHKPILFLYSGVIRTPLYSSTFNYLPITLGLIVICTGAGLLLYLTFEAPFLQMEKIFVSYGNTCHSSPPEQVTRTTNSHDEPTLMNNLCNQ